MPEFKFLISKHAVISISMERYIVRHDLISKSLIVFVHILQVGSIEDAKKAIDVGGCNYCPRTRSRRTRDWSGTSASAFQYYT